jgi:TetR/AcrR family transcriptional repressor of bet genes
MPPRNRETRRADIVSAFAGELAESGYEGATIARIARRAGLAPGLLHYHFASKREILEALLEGLVATLDARVARRSAEATTPRERLDALIDGLLARGDDADEASVATWASVAAEAVHREEVRQVYAVAVARVRQELRVRLVAVAAAEGRDVDADAASLAGTALIEGMVGLSRAAPGVVRVGEAAGTVRRSLALWLGGAR